MQLSIIRMPVWESMRARQRRAAARLPHTRHDACAQNDACKSHLDKRRARSIGRRVKNEKPQVAILDQCGRVFGSHLHDDAGGVGHWQRSSIKSAHGRSSTIYNGELVSVVRASIVQLRHEKLAW